MNSFTPNTATIVSESYSFHRLLLEKTNLAGIQLLEVKTLLEILPFPLSRCHFSHLKELQGNHLKLQHKILTYHHHLLLDLDEPEEWDTEFEKSNLTLCVTHLSNQVDDFKKSLFRSKANHKIL